MPPAEIFRVQTQCADPWGYGSNNTETIAKLTAYLLQKKMLVFKAVLVAVTCLACSCSRGFVFNIFTEPQYIDSLKNQGFFLK
jgi:hypothetical protein